MIVFIRGTSLEDDIVSECILNPIWTGGGEGAKWPLKVFAKYLRNGLADLHETL